MGPPSVSVCITNYNYAEYVAASIQSALDQTYEAVQVVVVDDGSTDGSEAVLERFRPQVTLIRQANAGQVTAARRALAASTGDVVIFLDADDLLDRDVVARVAAAFEEHPDATRVQWRMRVIGPTGDPVGTEVPPSHWPMPDGDLAGHVIRRRTYVWPPTSGNAYPRAVADRVLNAEGPEPRWIDLPLAEATPLLGRVVTLAGPGGSYRFHHDNHSLEWRRDWSSFLHDRIEETVRGHARLRGIAASAGREIPEDPLAALDWAFIAYRLASIRLDPRTHPIAADRRTGLALTGMAAVLTQPQYPWKARLKRSAWMAALALVPSGRVPGLVERAYGRPFGTVSLPATEPSG